VPFADEGSTAWIRSALDRTRLVADVLPTRADRLGMLAQQYAWQQDALEAYGMLIAWARCSTLEDYTLLEEYAAA
jgi:hypothetical protein